MNDFPKTERLNSKIIITELFKSNNHFSEQNVRVYWTSNKSDFNNIKVLISVPKKNIPFAVNRNKIKRLIRESYRKNKTILLNKSELNIGFVYLSTEIPKYNDVERKIKLILQRLNKVI